MRYFILITIFLLQGCSAYRSEFDCKAASSLGCKSTTEINSMVNRGMLGNDDFGEQIDQIAYLDVDNYLPNGVARTKEKILRIWIAPYKSNKDIYMQEQYLYKVVEHAKWIRSRK